MKNMFFVEEFIFFLILFYSIYLILYWITKYRIKLIMNDDIKITHVKWILYIPIWITVIFIIINLYLYVS